MLSIEEIEEELLSSTEETESFTEDELLSSTEEVESVSEEELLSPSEDGLESSEEEDSCTEELLSSTEDTSAEDELLDVSGPVLFLFSQANRIKLNANKVYFIVIS